MYQNPMHNNMMRRNNNTLRTVGIAVAVLLFLYGLYAYHDLHTRHKRSEEKSDRLRQQHDSLSAQLQVVYEQKSRLDKLLQQEKADHKQSKDDLSNEKKRTEQKFLSEKQELLNRIKSITSEHKMLQGQHDDLQSTFSKLQDQLLRLEEDYKKATEQHSLEYQQMRQEKDNELAQIKDTVANLQRHNSELQMKLQVAAQQNQISQGVANQYLNAKPAKQQAPNYKTFELNNYPKKQLGFGQDQQNLIQNYYNNRLKGNLVANLQQNQQQQQQGLDQQNIQQQQQQPQQQQQEQLLAQQQLQQFQQQQQQQQRLQQPQQQQQGIVQQAGLAGDLLHDALGMQNGQDHVQDHVQDHAAQRQQGMIQQQQGMIQQQQGMIQQQQGIAPQNQAVVGADQALVGLGVDQVGKQDQGPVMQVAQPGDGRQPYFDPKKAQPDHEMGLQGAGQQAVQDEQQDNQQDEQQDENGAGGVVHVQQVLPPNLNQQLGMQLQGEAVQQQEQPIRRDSMIMNDRAGINNWKNIQDSDLDNDLGDDKLDLGFHRNKQLDENQGQNMKIPQAQEMEKIPQQAPFQGVQANRADPIQADVLADRGPGQIVGPDIKDQHADRIEAPVAQGQGQEMLQKEDFIQDQDQMHLMNLAPPAALQQLAGRDNQLEVQGGQLQARDDLYHDNEDQGDGKLDNNDDNNDDNDDQDDDNGDQLRNYPN